MKTTGFDESPEELTSEEFANFESARKPVLSYKSILAMVRETEEPVEVESDEENGDDTIAVSDKCLQKLPSIEVRIAIETLMDFSFFMESEEVHRYMIKISAVAENELS